MAAWIPIGLIIFSLVFFVHKSLREKSKANTLLNFFQYGSGFKKKSFFATLLASNSGLCGAVYLIIVYGYFYGLGVFWWMICFWILTQIGSVYTIKKVDQLRSGFVSKNGTLHEFLGSMFHSTKVRMVAGAFSTIVYLGLVAAELVLGYEVLRAFIPGSVQIFGFSLVPLVFLLCLALIVVYYASRSGFRAIVATDKIQLTLIVIMIFSVLGFIVSHYSSFVESYTTHFVSLLDIRSVFDPLGEGVLSFLFFFVFMNLIFWGAWWPAAMDQWHRVAATKSSKSALDKYYGTLSVGSVLYFALLSFTFLAVGSITRILVETADGATQPLYYFLTEIVSSIGGSSVAVFVGAFGAGLIVLGLVALIISTVDTYLVVAGQSLVSDIILARRYRQSLSEMDGSLSKRNHEVELRFSRRVVLFLFVPVILFFFLITRLADVFTTIYFFFSFQMVELGALIVCFLLKDRMRLCSKSMLCGMVVGGLWALVTNIYLVFTINSMTLVGLVTEVMFYYNLLYANLAATLIVTLLVYFIVCYFSSRKRLRLIV
jgi:Na+/proline symporter